MSDVNPVTFRITARSFPSQGALAIQKVFDFTGGILIREGDLFEESERGLIDYVQSVKIDNSQNPAPLSLQFTGLGSVGDTVICPAQSILYSPVLVVAQQAPRYIVASAGGVHVTITFLNIELPYFVYSTAAPTPPVVPVVIGGISTAFSALVTGADQIAFPANVLAQRRVLQNPPANLNSMFVRSRAAAVADWHSQEILPGQQYDTASGPIDRGDLHLIGTAGDHFFATEISL